MDGKRFAGILTAALCVVVAAVVVVGPVGAKAERTATGQALDPAESLSISDRDIATPASLYSEEALATFADRMEIVTADGESIVLGDVPPEDYTGFIFEVTEPTDHLAAAVEQGTVRQIHGSTYAIDSLDDLAEIITADQLIYISPDYRMHLIGEIDGGDASADPAAHAGALDPMGGTATNPAPDYPPTDPEYVSGALWNLDMLNVQAAWEAGLDGDPYVYNNKPLRDTNVRVAVIDTGLYGTGVNEEQHEDLDYDKMFSGTNFVTDAEGTPDAHGHGTFVAGLIAAQVNNGIGVAGAQPGVEIVSEKVFDTGSASTEDVISAIYAAVDNDHADVINMSLGGEYNERSLEAACDYAVSQGVLVVASAGNDGVSTPNYPAAYDSVVGVASVNSSMGRSTWSQYGKSVFVTAPGENVTSTFQGASNAYKTASGTSFSGPEVAALAAMCKSVYPDIDQDTFKQFLIDTSYDLGAKGYDDYFGWGLVDFGAMAEAVLSSQVMPWYYISFDITDEDGRAIDVANASITLTAAEDISWDADEEGGVPEAGEWPQGTVIAQESDGTFKVHRGTYAYTVAVDGKYSVQGTFKTYTEHQRVAVTMSTAYAITLNVVDSAGAAIGGATHQVSSRDGRIETPKSGSASSASAVYDLASGIYTYEASATGYEAAAGTFTVQRADKAIQAVLYRSDELTAVHFTVTDRNGGATVANAMVSVTDASGVTIAAQEDGSWLLAKGKTYSATASKAGFESSTTEFTVGNEEQTVALEMQRASNLITFDVVDEGGKAIASATAKVADGEGGLVDPVPTNNLQFSLVEGDYTYEVTAPGYSVKTGSFGVALDSYTITVALEAIPNTITFAVTDEATGASISDATIKVNLSDRLRAIEPNGPNSYLLTPGEYDYTVFKEGYQVAQGTFTVAGEDLVVPVALQAAGEGAGYAGGSGTEEDPYLIATEDQLRYLASQTDLVRVTSTTAPTNKKETLAGYFRLMNDIELTQGEWLPIGNYENGSNWVAFGGEFDGGGHTISGLQISESAYDYQGLFGYVRGAYIHDLVVDGEIYVNAKSSTSGGSYVGGIVGGAFAANDSQYTSNNTSPVIIERCGSYVDITARYALGGIIGSAQGSTPSSGIPDGAPDDALITIRDCFNKGELHAMLNGDYMRQAGSGQVAAGKRAGGIVGSAQYALIENCYNMGDVFTGESTGGITGYANLTTITSCYSSGQLMQHSNSAGEGGKTGFAAGAAVRTNAEHVYGLSRTDNYSNDAIGTPGAYVTSSDTAALSHIVMYRTASFVDTLNEHAASANADEVFILGHDYPMLYWELDPGTVPARTPVIIQHPAGIEMVDAYVQGSVATALTAAVEEIPASDGDVSWQWFVSDTDSFKDAAPAPQGIGSGFEATYVPSTDEVGAKYYFCVFTNRLGLDLNADEISATSHSAVIYVRASEPASTPVITQLNPNGSSDFNTHLALKQGTDLHMSVTAAIEDDGELTYQWYSSPTGSGAGTPIEGATSSIYGFVASTLGTTYYYVEVTNTTGPGNVSKALSDWIQVDINPYTIENYQELASFRTAVNSGNTFNGQIVYLLADIAIPDGVDWTPIGTADQPFQGTFMGGTGYAGSDPAIIATHKITNLAMNGDAHENTALGLFGVISGATICDVQVGGTITGANNTNSGLLVGQAMGNGSTASSIENCGTLEGSSVEGAYSIGGLAGYSQATMANCANHADVHGHAYAGNLGSGSIASDSKYAVGGVSGYQNSGYMLGCYNTGTITVDGPGSDTVCATRVGGVAGATGYYSGVASCYNAGTLDIAKVATSQYERGALYIGSVVGYLNSAAGVNCYYMEGTWEPGTDGSDHIDIAEMRSTQFMKTSYFTELLNTGASSYSYAQYRDSGNGVPHFVWEAENKSSDEIRSAEPYITNITSVDFPNITQTFAGAYFQNTEYIDPIIVWADTPDGGQMRFEWRMRPAGADDDAWQVVASGEMEPDENGKNGQAPVTVDVSEIGTYEYMCEVYNKRADATAEPLEESMYIPAITITVKDAAGVISLRDPETENSKDNPWVIDTAAKMKFFADIVNGEETYRPIADSTFEGQYVELAADIDISDYAPWTPVGSNTSTYNPTAGVFKGIFDGAGHTIEGLSIVNPDRNDYNGLFGHTRLATIRNLEVAGEVRMDSASALGTGGVVGYAYGTFIENVVNRVNVTGAVKTGGIVGYGVTDKILDCENLGTVTMNDALQSSTYGGYDVGGIAGYMSITAGAEGAGIFNCFNNGTVTGGLYDGDYRIGAIVGGTGSFSDTQYAHNYYRAGSIVVTGGTGTGIGGGSYVPVADAAGKCMAISSTNSPETAYALGTSDGTADNSGRWSNYTREDIGDTADCVHLVLGQEAAATYRIDVACEAAGITASAAYAVPGDEITVSWESKPGFAVSAVYWQAVGSDEKTLLGEGVQGEGAAFTMPAADVIFVVEATQDETYRYAIAAEVLYNGEPASEGVGSVTVLTATQGAEGVLDELSGNEVSLELSISEGYQLKGVSVTGTFGTDVPLRRVDGLHYAFTMPAEDVTVSVQLEDAGSQADEAAASLAVDTGALHITAGNEAYQSPNLLYDTVVFSGSFFRDSLYLGRYEGGERPFMTYQLERDYRTDPGLYTQDYTVLGDIADKMNLNAAEPQTYRFTGLDLAKLIEKIAGAPCPAAAPVRIETADGSAYVGTYADLTSLAYSSYDASGQPVTRGLPVLLYFGVDGTPNAVGEDESGSVGVVFGQTSADDRNAGKVYANITRICVGDDINYSQHVWSTQYIDYADMDEIAGGTANDETGYTDLTVRVYRGDAETGELVSEKSLSLLEIEAMAREDFGNIQHGYYSTMLYENRDEATDGPYCDYYEGYDLMKVLEAAGVPTDDVALASGSMQFFQTGVNGLENSWKTVDVSLAYLAGNGDKGAGDYSNNSMTYLTGSDGTSPIGSGTVTGLKPMLVYGKNGLPLVWGSGTDVYGYNYGKYNYRGPMMAFLPQNAVEGGSHVGSQTVTSCYLGLIEVYLPEDWQASDEPPTPVEADRSQLEAAIADAQAAADGVKTSADGADVDPADTWVTAAVGDALDKAVSDGQAVLADDAATQDDVDAAAKAIREALAAYAPAPGTKSAQDDDPGTSDDPAQPDDPADPSDPSEPDDPTPSAPVSIAKASVSVSPASVRYTDEPGAPVVAVTLDGKTLAEGDYTVSWSGAHLDPETGLPIEVGDYVATVTGLEAAGYVDSATVAFSIQHVDMSAMPDLLVDDWFTTEKANAGAFYDDSTLYLDYAIAHGLMTGYRDKGTDKVFAFGPNDQLTRAQAAVVIYRMMNPGQTGAGGLNGTGLPDVASDEYYTAAVNWCFNKGIITGYRDPATGVAYAFGPEDPVTRSQIATMIARLCSGGESELAGYPTASAMEYTDSIETWALEGVAWCRDNKVMKGYENGAFGANDPTTRAQMAKIASVVHRTVISD